MAIKSARFAYDSVFVNVAKNSTTLCKGSEGGSVEALQQALLDLGYSMPISTSTSDGAPDGIFGDETDQAVRTFQGEVGLGVDGVVGPQTIGALDELAAFQDLRPLRGAIDGLSTTTDTIMRDPEARAIVGHDAVHALWSSTTNMKASLLLYEPHPQLPPARLWLANVPGGGMGMSATATSAHPLAMLFAVFLLALFGAMRPMKKGGGPHHSPKSSASKQQAPVPPAAILIPVVRAWELLIFAQKVQEIGAAVLWLLVREQVKRIRACEGDHPDRKPACDEALKAFYKIQSKLLTQLNDLKGGKERIYPTLLRAANLELVNYYKALEAVIKCLGCKGVW